MKRPLLLIGAICLLLSTATGCYAAGPWRGKVIDAETKQPIEGAVVVAVWYKTLRGPAGPSTSYLDARETLTDKEGRFEVPSFWALHIFFVREVSGPIFTIYKPGYGSYPRYQVSPKPPIPYETIFEKKEDVVELPKLQTEKERLDSVMGAHTRAPWKDTPELLKLVNQEYISLGIEPYKIQ